MSQDHHDLIARAITYLDDHAASQPGLDEVAEHVAMSPTHLQRVFTAWAGVSPKRFVQFLTAEHAAGMLAEDRPVLDVAHAAGLSSAGRLHDLIVTVHAVTPGQVRRRGEGLTIRYGVHESPFGPVLVGATERGVCHLAFVDDAADAMAALRDRWPGADLVEDVAATAEVARVTFDAATHDGPLPVLLSGTNLQVQVWQALLRIPTGTAVSYGDVAAAIGRPSAVRAVASAIGANRVGVLIPCHRVLRSTGAISGYHWGPDRKRRLLAWESARATVAA